jgi:hypothetical protein
MGKIDAAFFKNSARLHHPRAASAALFALPAILFERGPPIGGGKPFTEALLKIEKVRFNVV